MNGAPEILDLVSLELRNGTIYLGGKSAGSWPSQWASTPVNPYDAERVLALYNASGAGGGAGWHAAGAGGAGWGGASWNGVSLRRRMEK